MEHAEKFVLITNCEVFEDSDSGMAFRCGIEGNLVWVPYSQCRTRHINERVYGEDSIEVTAWWAEKNEIEGEQIP